MTKHEVTIYFDTADPDNEGWVFRYRIGTPTDFGAHTWRNVESGALDVSDSASAARIRLAWAETMFPGVDGPSVEWEDLPEGWRGTWYA